jgi:hypothetical protein
MEGSMQTERFRAVVQRLAGAYARRCSWTDYDELEQVGWVAAFKASRSFPGGDLDRYVTRAINLSMRASAVSDASPASTPQNPSRQVVERLRLLSRVALLPDLPAREVPADQQLELARWRARVSARVAELLAAYVRRNDPGLEVVLRERPPAEVAAGRRLAVRHVYGAADRVRVHLRRDPTLRELLAERLQA